LKVPTKWWVQMTVSWAAAAAAPFDLQLNRCSLLVMMRRRRRRQQLQQLHIEATAQSLYQPGTHYRH
jgi:hypothetical protein